jgi:hypothetical protein
MSLGFAPCGDGMGKATVRWAWLRYLPTPLDARPVSEEISCPVKVLDLSPAGIRLALPQSMPVGAILAINLLLAPKKFGHTMFARVVDMRAHNVRTWIGQCAFLIRLTQEEVDTLLRDSARPGTKPSGSPGPESCRREFGRAPVGVDIACSVATRADRPLPATIVNISNGGVCLSVAARFEIGESLEVAFASASRRLVRKERVVVRHAVPGPDHRFELGCEFTKRLTRRELAALIT